MREFSILESPPFYAREPCPSRNDQHLSTGNVTLKSRPLASTGLGSRTERDTDRWRDVIYFILTMQFPSILLPNGRRFAFLFAAVVFLVAVRCQDCSPDNRNGSGGTSITTTLVTIVLTAKAERQHASGSLVANGTSETFSGLALHVLSDSRLMRARGIPSIRERLSQLSSLLL